jgi:hypothetical protein
MSEEKWDSISTHILLEENPWGEKGGGDGKGETRREPEEKGKAVPSFQSLMVSD